MNPLLIGGAVAGVLYFFFHKKKPAPYYTPPVAQPKATPPGYAPSPAAQTPPDPRIARQNAVATTWGQIKTNLPQAYGNLAYLQNFWANNNAYMSMQIRNEIQAQIDKLKRTQIVVPAAAPPPNPIQQAKDVAKQVQAVADVATGITGSAGIDLSGGFKL